MYDEDAAVDAGVTLLDKYAPEDWRERVARHGPLTGSAMYSIYTCVLGRVFDSWADGMDALGLDRKHGRTLHPRVEWDSVIYGFEGASPSGDNGPLAAAWNRRLGL